MDPNTWEFELRRGVRFHDGTPFTAEDVVFSIERARAGTSELQTPVANIAAIQALDDRTLHITTTAPDPLLWMRLGFVVMRKNRTFCPTPLTCHAFALARRRAAITS